VYYFLPFGSNLLPLVLLHMEFRHLPLFGLLFYPLLLSSLPYNSPDVSVLFHNVRCSIHTICLLTRSQSYFLLSPFLHSYNLQSPPSRGTQVGGIVEWIEWLSVLVVACVHFFSLLLSLLFGVKRHSRFIPLYLPPYTFP